ncbi:MAG: hypothetical protein EXQ91_05235 [Alphaproteobacteria bacterium]|nr:hypothetical protein [Alphaproteobacteria bacterium]
MPRWHEKIAGLVADFPVVLTAATALADGVSPAGGADIVLPAITFFEYLHGVDPDLAISSEGDAPSIEALNWHFFDYFNEGAFPNLPGVSGSERFRRLSEDLLGSILCGDLAQRFGVGDARELARLFTASPTVTCGGKNEH